MSYKKGYDVENYCYSIVLFIYATFAFMGKIEALVCS